MHHNCYQVTHVAVSARYLQRNRMSWISYRLVHDSASRKLYRPLNSNKHEIRVLKIRPGSWNDTIDAELVTVSLDTWIRPRYDVLSYTWGNPEPARAINVSGETTTISPSLFEALRALRHQRKPVTIWADALCIDQGNNGEKSWQVKMMGRIYHQGRQTWVSLGYPEEPWADGTWSPASHLPATAFRRLLRVVWRVFLHNVLWPRTRKSRLGIGHIHDSLRLINMAHPSRSGHPADVNRSLALSMMDWLATHKYWERVWVVQEVALSRYDPICIFGRHHVPLLALETFMSELDDPFLTGSNNCAAHKMIWSPEVGRGIAKVAEMCMVRDRYFSALSFRPSGYMDLRRVLEFASHRQATIAHDHVFGLHSLLPKSDQEQIQPDYKISIHDLYSSATKLLLHREGSMDVLCAAVGVDDNSKHKLPSWSLDFSHPMKLPARLSEYVHNPKPFQPDTVALDLLSVEATLVARTSYPSMPTTELDHDLLENPLLSTFLDKHIYVQDRTRWTPHDDEHDSEHEARRIVRSDTRTSEVAKERSYAGGESRSSSENVVILDTIHGVNVGRCSRPVEPGDEVWLLKKSNIPFVLRPGTGSESGNKKYRLVGPCRLMSPANATHESHVIELH